jgi:predicted metallopeptidase
VRKYIRSNKRKKIDWKPAPDVKRKILLLRRELKLDWINLKRIYCVRSSGSSSNAIARIWGLGRLWQMVLNTTPAYVIEVMSEKFDRLGESQKDKVLLHEIAHIPKNFSGSLMPHVRRGKNKFADRVRVLVAQYTKGVNN